MTFTEIVTEITSQLNLTSSDATSRVGRKVNRAYKRVTASIGLNVSRRTQVQADVTLGVQTLTFTGIEKITAVIDKSSGSDRFLDILTVEELKEGPIGTGSPTKYAIYRMNAGTVQILMDTLPQDALTLYADGYERASTLSGSQEPAFPESFHDILVEEVLAEEYTKKGELAAAKEARDYAENLTGDLRMFIAKEAFQDIHVAKMQSSMFSGSVSGGGGSAGTINGAASWTQTGLISFDRDPLAPFAVSASSAVVTNLDADKLDGEEGSAYHNATNLNAGTIPDARLGSNVPLKDGTNAFTGANSFATNPLNLLVGQIAFPAAQNASADANTLDDYEEGSWTPSLTSGGGGVPTYTLRVGAYTKIGRVVQFQAQIQLATKGTLAAGSLGISGLPFTSAASGAIHIGFLDQLATSVSLVFGLIGAGSTTITVYHLAAAGGTSGASLAVADINATFHFVISGSYYV